jgi:hypothetical protein
VGVIQEMTSATLYKRLNIKPNESLTELTCNVGPYLARVLYRLSEEQLDKLRSTLLDDGIYHDTLATFHLAEPRSLFDIDSPHGRLIIGIDFAGGKIEGIHGTAEISLDLVANSAGMNELKRIIPELSPDKVA